MKKLLVLAAFGICAVGLARAELPKRIDGIINQSFQGKVRFSIHVIKADTGDVAYSHNSKEAMIPASNMKVVVTAAALKYLGSDYEYKTKVGLCGDTLVVIGSGDPLLGDKTTDAKYGRENGWIFEDIATALKQNGVTTINDIIIDSSIFDDQRVHPNWPKEQLNRWYACEVAGLNFNDNCVDISAETVGGRVIISIEPKTGYIEVINKVVPISNGSGTIGSYRQPEANKIVVHGKCKGKSISFPVAIERPAAFFGFLLAENLARQGINVEGQLLGKSAPRDCSIRLIREYNTPITDCLSRCNKNSFGLAAEALLKTIAVNVNPTGKNGSWAGGREAIHKYLTELGVEGSEFYVDDGGGLSRENKLSANAITRILLDVYKSGNWQLFRDSLAVGGQEGTISRYFKEKGYRGKILGKTGYIAGVKSFSGVCCTDGGDYIFSILTNGANGRTRGAINDIAKAIVDESSLQN